MLRKP
ncbi:hypothetical protein VCHE16_3074, partial [Vibrio paracholerae HE-16]